jgi:hypothetical protein
MKKSPYLSSDTRLADVIAALQATATYKFYQLPVDGDNGWAYRITGDPNRSNEVETVFAEHPEFFRRDRGGNWALVWRRQHQKLFDVDANTEISRTAFDSLDEDARGRISRTPLDPTQVTALIDAAIELHAGALAHQQERRWLWTPVITLASAFGGALLGGLV